MGIKGLSAFIKKICPEIYTEIPIRNYAYQKVAIDISLYLYKYKIIHGLDWLRALINLVCCLRRNDVHCIFIYETGCPPEKEEKRKERREAQDKLKAKLMLIEDAYFKMLNEGVVDDILIEITEKVKNKPILRKKSEGVVDQEIIEKEIAKLKAQTRGITKEDIIQSQELFNTLGIPYLEIEDEGERVGSWLCLSGKVDAVLSEDTDVMVYGTPKFLCKIDVSKDTFVEINTSEILEILGMKLSEFQDFCIMCGTDYNPNIPKIGPIKSYDFIRKEKTIEAVEKKGIDVSCLNHIRVRQLFSYNCLKDDIMIKLKDYSVPYCKQIDDKKVSKFLSNKGYASLFVIIKKAFSEPEIIFE